MDVVFVGLMIGLWLLVVGMAIGCARLGGPAE